MKLGRRIFTLMVAVLLITSMELTAMADTWYLEQGDVVVNASDSGQTVTQGEVTKADSAPVITQQDSSVPTSNTIVVNTENGADANITIKDVNIQASDEAAIEVSRSEGSEVTVELDGNNTLKGGKYDAAMQVDGTGELIIEDKDNNGSLTAQGDQYAAGIGGGADGDGDNITINGGKIEATGGDSGAGIGGGLRGSASDITINGGEVKATGGSAAAGIGGGHDADGINITINGGVVEATGNNAAGIGGGHNGDGIEITISGGNVTAVGKANGAGIGGGQDGNGTNITINGGNVEAKGSSLGAGIGGGNEGAGTNITISGGNVTATGGSYGAGIGGGSEGNGTDITISGGKVNAQAGSDSAAIGGGKDGQGSNLVVKNNAVVVALGDGKAADAGNGYLSNKGQQEDNVNLDDLYTTGSYTNRYGTVYGTKRPPNPWGDHVCNKDGAAIRNGNLYCKCGKVLVNLFTVDCPWVETLEDGTLTVTVSEADALLTYWLFGVKALVEQNVHTLVFVTAEAETVLDLNQWLGTNPSAETYQIQHKAAEAKILQTD